MGQDLWRLDKTASGGGKFLIIKDAVYVLIKLERNENADELSDYKFFCFGGKMKCFKIDFGRFTEHHANYYDREGRLLPWGESHYPPKPEAEVLIPDNLRNMVACAEKISKELPFVRVDLYNSANQIFFGEITFFPASGMGRFTDLLFDKEIGNWLQLPKNN